MTRSSLVVLAGATLLLAGCGGSGDFSAPGTGAPGGGTQSSVASINFTQPRAAVVDLANGDYRLSGKLDVTDRDGRAVPDGTNVDLILLDTVILQDNTGAVVVGALDVLTRSGPSLITTRCNSQFAVEASGCVETTSSFTSTVVRSNSIRGILPGDFVVMRNTDPQDRFRRVLSVNDGTSLRLDRPLARAYSGIELWVGTAASGFSVAGFNPTTSALTIGRATTIQGEAEFRTTYPANIRTLNYGCFGYLQSGAAFNIDQRDAVPQSRQVLIAATAPNGITAVNVRDSCAKSIAPSKVEADVTTLTLTNAGDSEDVNLTITDGGQGIALAYADFRCVRTEGPSSLTVTPSSAFADVQGLATITITRGPVSANDEDGAVQCSVTGSSGATPVVITVMLPVPTP